MSAQNNHQAGKGKLFILSAPSGAGKSTLCRIILQHFPDIHYSISHTTRPPRGEEKNGVHYHFLSKDEFFKGIENNHWAEWAEVHGNYYGTSKEFIETQTSAGQHVLLDIDVQGTLQIIKKFPESITIFIMPPSFETLRIRMEARGTDSPEIIERRMHNAKQEIAHKDQYRHVVINEDLSNAAAELISIVGQYRSRA